MPAHSVGHDEEPLGKIDDEGILGVLEILDKRGDAGFDLRDIELATVFARQATVAIRSSRIERDTATLLRAVLGATDASGAVARPGNGAGGAVDDLDSIIAAEVRSLDGDGNEPLWALADSHRIADLAVLDAPTVGDEKYDAFGEFMEEREVLRLGTVELKQSGHFSTLERM